MFKQVIRSTPLTTDAANSFFQHIYGEHYMQDVSFISTLRALVAPRMKENESLALSFYQTNYTASQLSERSTKAAVREVCDLEYCDPGRIIIHNFANTQENNYAWLELMKSTLTSVYPGWHRLEKVTDFYKKSFYVLCFINPEIKSVVLFVDNMNMQKMHYLQCSIFALLPWYFDPKLGVSKLEMGLIESLRGKNSAEYENCIAEIAEQYDFRTMKIKQLLAGFETRYESLQCDAIRQEIQGYIDTIDSLNRQIGDILSTKNDREVKLLGLETKIANSSEESEIMDYFLRNQNVVLESVGRQRITFAVKTYLEYFDEDLAERVIRNDMSYVYHPNGRGCNNIIVADDMRKLMTAIFLEQKLRIKFCAAYQFDMNGNVRGLGSHGYGFECRECTPNPHIDRYQCLGSYNMAINELLKRHDYIGAIEQCSASCRSLNFNDSAVMSEFMRRMYGISDYHVNMKCIELPNGTMATPVDAIKWLKEQEESGNE